MTCAPTYATSHRWGWPDERGVMRCACGGSTETRPASSCSIHAVALSADVRARNAFNAVELDEDERMTAFGFGRLVHDPVEAERQRCERLGVEWVGPDVQAYEAPLGEGGRIGGHVWALRGRVASEHRAAVEEATMCGQGRVVTHSAHKAHGGIVRLGLELREADGVTAR